MSGTIEVSVIKNPTEEQLLTLSNYISIYAVQNFIKAYEDSPYIDAIKNIVHLDKELEMIDEPSGILGKSPVPNDREFITENDIKGYFKTKYLAKYKENQLRNKFEQNNQKYALKLDGEETGFFIGDLKNNILTIDTFIVAPDYQNLGIGYQFASILFSNLRRESNLCSIVIDIKKDYTYPKKIYKFLNLMNFQRSENTTFILKLD